MKYKEFLIKWIAALRSGEYQQGREYLYRDEKNNRDAYCCLGVGARLCDIPTDDLEKESFLRPALQGEYALPEYLTDRKWETIFATLNDGSYAGKTTFNKYAYNFFKSNRIGEQVDPDRIKVRSHSFEEIADIIEKYILNETTE